MTGLRKLTVNLTEGEYEGLRDFAAMPGMPDSMTGVVRQSLVDEHFLYEAARAGACLLAVNPATGAEQEVVFVPHHSPFIA